MNKREKVFIVGFHKTGTSSMGKAFQILGYRVCGSIKNAEDFANVEMPVRKYIISEAKKLIPEYDCFQDTPWFMFYRELYQLYPNSYFILTVRPDREWLKSVVDYFGNRNNSSYHEWIYGYSDPLMNKQAYLETYQKHNESVINFFKNKSNFLKINIKEKNKWRKLSNFLSVSTPIIKFPHANAFLSHKKFPAKFKQRLKHLYYK